MFIFLEHSVRTYPDIYLVEFTTTACVLADVHGWRNQHTLCLKKKPLDVC